MTGMASFGNWVYSDDFVGNITNLDTGGEAGTITIFGDGVKVGDAAQTTVGVGMQLEIIDGLRLYGDYYFADNLFADFSIQDSRFRAPGAQAIKVPSYSLLDAGISYDFKFGDQRVTLRGNVNNVLDELYIAELETNGDTLDESQGFFGFGRTWNTTLKWAF